MPLSTDLSPETLCGAVWAHLSVTRGARPTVSDVACAVGLSARRLRQECRARGLEAPRRQIMHGCISFAAALICEGTKMEAAIRLAGLHSRWNFNRQCRRMGYRSAGSRNVAIDPRLDSGDVTRSVAAFRRRPAEPEHLVNPAEPPARCKDRTDR